MKDGQSIIFILIILGLGLIGLQNTTDNGLSGTSSSTAFRASSFSGGTSFHTQAPGDSVIPGGSVQGSTSQTGLNELDISRVSQAGREADREYITIKAGRDNPDTINMTDWTLKSLKTGREAKIGGAVVLYVPGQKKTESSVLLSPGGVVHVNTGRSPFGKSFQTNVCLGYVARGVSINQGVSGNCPFPGEEINREVPDTPANDVCRPYIESFPRCTVQRNPLPLTFTPECTNFIYDRFTYDYCVQNNKSTPGFYENDWRIYLNRTSSLWQKSRERIVLVSPEGQVVSEYSF